MNLRTWRKRGKFGEKEREERRKERERKAGRRGRVGGRKVLNPLSSAVQQKMVSSSAWAVITRYHRLGGWLRTELYFS